MPIVLKGSGSFTLWRSHPASGAVEGASSRLPPGVYKDTSCPCRQHAPPGGPAPPGGHPARPQGRHGSHAQKQRAGPWCHRHSSRKQRQAYPEAEGRSLAPHSPPSRLHGPTLAPGLGVSSEAPSRGTPAPLPRATGVPARCPGWNQRSGPPDNGELCPCPCGLKGRGLLAL